MMFAGCQNEELVNDSIMQGGEEFTLVINEGVESRTQLDENKTKWSVGDELYVTSIDGQVKGVLKFQGSSASERGQFKGFVFGGKASSLSHVIFPVPVDGKVVLNQPEGNKLDLPMFGGLSFTDGQASATLDNVCAMVNLPVSGDGISNGSEVELSEESGLLTGHYKFDNGSFIFVPDAEGSVTIKINNGKALFAAAAKSGNVEAGQVNISINDGATVTIPVQSGEVETNIPGVEINNDGPMIKTVDSESTLMKAVAEGGSIKLVDNINITKTLEIASGKVVTLDLNGYSILGEKEKHFEIVEESDGTQWENEKIENCVIENQGRLIINGEGTIKNNIVNGAPVIYNQGNLTLNGITIDGGQIGDTSCPSYTVYTSGNMTINGETTISTYRGALYLIGEGETTINGGEFIINDHERVLTSHVVVVGNGANNKLTINNGTFKHLHKKTSGGVVINNWSAVTVDIYNGDFSGGNYYGKWDNLSDYGYGMTTTPFAVKGGTFTGMDSNYIADGYQLKDNNDGTWSVVPTSVEE